MNGNIPTQTPPAGMPPGGAPSVFNAMPGAAPTGGKSKKGLVIIIVIIIVLALAGLGFWYWQSQKTAVIAPAAPEVVTPAPTPPPPPKADSITQINQDLNNINVGDLNQSFQGVDSELNSL